MKTKVTVKLPKDFSFSTDNIGIMDSYQSVIDDLKIIKLNNYDENKVKLINSIIELLGQAELQTTTEYVPAVEVAIPNKCAFMFTEWKDVPDKMEKIKEVYKNLGEEIERKSWSLFNGKDSDDNKIRAKVYDALSRQLLAAKFETFDWADRSARGVEILGTCFPYKECEKIAQLKKEDNNNEDK